MQQTHLAYTKANGKVCGVSAQAIDQHIKTLTKLGELDGAIIKQYLVQKEGLCTERRKINQATLTAF